MSPPDSSSEEAPGRTMARNSTIDAVVAVCLVVVGIVQIVEARRLGAEWTSDGPGAATPLPSTRVTLRNPSQSATPSSKWINVNSDTSPRHPHTRPAAAERHRDRFAHWQ